MEYKKMTTEERKQQVENLVGQAEEQLTEYLKSGKYKDFLKNMSNLYNYSIHNQMLILMQREDTTKVKGMSGWNYLGRSVIPGEKGIKIIIPIIKKVEAENENKELIKETVSKVIGFKAGYVFDISQTNGKDIELFKFDHIAEDYFNEVESALRECVPNYKVIYAPKISSGADGMCAKQVKIITVKEAMPKEKTLTTLIHEIAHSFQCDNNAKKFAGLSDKEIRQVKEIEAESVAFVVSHRLGLKTEEFNMSYIANWSNEKIERFKETVGEVKRISTKILNTIEPIIVMESKIEESKENIKENEGEM